MKISEEFQTSIVTKSLVNIYGGYLFTVSEVSADIFRDPDTGFSFSQKDVPITTNNDYITFRIAIPSPAPAGQPYDTVLQIVAPVVANWVGVAWGASMLNNPLLLGWPNGASGVVSMRRAT